MLCSVSLNYARKSKGRHGQMTNYAQIYLIFANCGWIYGQKWPDLWPKGNCRHGHGHGGHAGFYAHALNNLCFLLNLTLN